jgi:hypothetical protein
LNWGTFGYWALIIHLTMISSAVTFRLGQNLLVLPIIKRVAYLIVTSAMPVYRYVLSKLVICCIAAAAGLPTLTVFHTVMSGYFDHEAEQNE